MIGGLIMFYRLTLPVVVSLRIEFARMLLEGPNNDRQA